MKATAVELIAHARAALAHAYAPYSRFAVGAAVVDDQGRVFAGANVENASYGLAMCAERVAIFSAIAAGAARIAAVAVTARKARPVTPCGACRQVIAEFCGPDVPVFADAGRGKFVTWTAAALLPGPFTAEVVLGRGHPAASSPVKRPARPRPAGTRR